MLNRYLSLLALLIGLFLGNPGHTQSLSPGDIAFVAYRADAVATIPGFPSVTDAFSFVVLDEIAAGTVILFTDRGIKVNGDFVTGNPDQEGIITYTVPMGGLDCGVVVNVLVLPTGVAVLYSDGTSSTTDAVITNTGFSLDAADGDQVLAYQGDDNNPTFIAAINNSGNTGEWQTMSIGVNESILPPGLTDGVTAISLVEVDNANYNNNITTGIKPTLLTTINNEINWVGSNDPTLAPYVSFGFMVTDCNADEATITHTGTAPVGTFINSGTGDVVLYQIQVDVMDENVVLTDLEFTTAGDWVADDVAAFQLWFSDDATFDNGDELVATLEQGYTGGAETLSFDDFQQPIPVGTGYLFITLDASGIAFFCREISVQVDDDSDLTYSQTPTFVGSSFAMANTFTLGSGIVVNAQFTQTAVSVVEGDNGSMVTYQVDVLVEGRPCGDITVNVTSMNGSATAGADYVAVNEFLVFSPNQDYPQTQQVNFTVLGDAAVEGNETFKLMINSVSGFGQAGANSMLTVTIVGDDVAPINYYSNCQGADPCNWSAAIWNTAADGTGTVITNPNNPNANIIIQNGDVVTLNVSGRALNNLTVESGGELTAIGGTTNVNYLNVFGNTITVDGTTFGAVGINNRGPDLTIDGSGSIAFRRIRHLGLVDAMLTFASTANPIQLTYSAGSALYNAISNYSFDVDILQDVEVEVTAGNVSIDGNDGTNGGERTGTYTVNGLLTITQGILVLTTDNEMLGIDYVITSSGKIFVGGSIQGSAEEVNISRTANLTIDNGGVLEVAGDGIPFDNLDAFSTVSPGTQSTIIYSGGNQLFSNDFVYGNVWIEGGGNKSMVGDATVTGLLRLTDGFLSLGTFDLNLVITSSMDGGSASSYVRTNGTGQVVWAPSGTAGRDFIIGNSSFNPITINNNGVDDTFSIRVLDQVLTNGNSGSPVAENVVNRTWLISEGTPGGSDLNVNVQWNGSEELTGFDRDNSYISVYFGNGWQGDTPSMAIGDDPYQQVRTNIGNVTALAVASNEALPVTWLAFDATRKREGNQLNWVTTNEIDNSHFIVERSADGQNFQAIGRVEGQGTTDEVSTYDFFDSVPLTGENYYRLRQVDYSGAASYSIVRMVRWSVTGKAHVYPNPVRGELRVELPTQAAGTYEVVNNLGQLLLQAPFGVDIPLRIDTETLDAGTYWLRLRQGSETTVLKFTKL